MKPSLNWEVDSEGFVFSCSLDDSLIPVEQWAMHEVCLAKGQRAGVGPLLRLLEDEVAHLIAEGKKVFLSHEVIAALDASELRLVGLPEYMPFNLSIEGRGLLADREFFFQYRLIHADFRPVMGTSRTGTLLRVGEWHYIIPDPFFSIIRDMEIFNNTPPEDMEARLVAWAMIKEYLPEDVIVGDYLKSFSINRADAFTIIPFVNALGEPDFDPIVMRSEKTDSDEELGEESLSYVNALPKAPQDSFAGQFRGFRHSRGSYALGGGWFLVLSEPLKMALSAIHEVLTEDVGHRLNFLSNPYSFLREKLEDEIDEEILESLFYESAEYSERVRDIGLWQPPVLPYISPAKEPWLPPEELGLRVGDTLIKVDVEDIDRLIESVEKAIEEGETTIEYKDQRIPAKPETVQALMRLITEARPDLKDDVEDKERSEEEEKTRIALLIKGNLDELDYTAEKRPIGGETGSWPGCVNTLPLSHQQQGVLWLQEHWVSGSTGSLLADDMGLGKTLQALSFMAWLQAQMYDGTYPKSPMLVVAPTGLLKNWVDEHEMHLQSPGLGEAVEAYGSHLKSLRHPRAGSSKELDVGLPVLDADKLKTADWVLTTYETLRDYQHSFGKIRWGVAVYDEAQKIKNPSALMTDAAKAMHSDFVLTLTGTPVENRLSDLWCIVDTSQPGRLGSLKEFSSLYEKSVDKGPDLIKELKSQLTVESTPTIMLRRMKEDHLDGLPPKREHPIKRNMPEPQAKAYEEAVLRARAGDRRRGKILEALHALRSISLHPFLRGEESDAEYIQNSARLAITLELIDEIAQKNDKVLVFIESRQMQGILSEIIQRRYRMSTPPLIINGAVSGARRKERVDIFQNRPNFDVMLLSPKAGGVGLTLTAANNVIHLSRWWNPAVEDQCTDRVFRIGQKRTVNIYYPMAIHPNYTDHSFDVRLHALLERKRELSRTILAPPAATQGDAENLFSETVDTEENWDPDHLAAIDTMEPEAFEVWVLERLAAKGYQVKRTPRSWDGGADGLAIATQSMNLPNLIIQCKHTQTDRPVGHDAVRQVLRSLESYSNSGQSFSPVVVTNSNKFSDKAISLAREKGVQLVGRKELVEWIN